MSKKLSNKFLFKAYYNLLLIREIKENSFEDFNSPYYSMKKHEKLAEMDLEELDECIAIFKEMVDVACDEAYIENSGTLVELLTEDPYYKIVQMVYAAEDKTKKSMSSKKIDKKLMN
jgi:hypothetical protein